MSANAINPDFQKWATGYAGCDGGDLGSSHQKSIWICGIEWGIGHTPEELSKEFEINVTQPPEGYSTEENQCNYIFNRNTIKLLTVINGRSIESYKTFLKDENPFVVGSKGYFKMNLYPIAFKNTSLSLWKEGFAKVSGFLDKRQYQEWCRNERFPKMRS